MKTGTIFDIHRFIDWSRFLNGSIKIRHEKRLLGHSGSYLFLRLAFIAVFTLAFLCSATIAEATQEYAEQTEQKCAVCHLDEETGKLSETGEKFSSGGYLWPIDSNAGPLLSLGPLSRSLVGYFHILASFIWFGTIIYVHIILRPAYASKGLPRAEVRMGAVSMVVVGLSGITMLLSRVKSFSILTETAWGNLLLAKISFYIIMVSFALFVVRFLGPKLCVERKDPVHPKRGLFDPETLSAFDGKSDRPAYIAYLCKVYDVTTLAKWKGGGHFKHRAGEDLTSSIARAPHGPKLLERAKTVGRYDAEGKPPLGTYQKIFYAIAYINLLLVFIVLLVISFWRWGV